MNGHVYSKIEKKRETLKNAPQNDSCGVVKVAFLLPFTQTGTRTGMRSNSSEIYSEVRGNKKKSRRGSSGLNKCGRKQGLEITLMRACKTKGLLTRNDAKTQGKKRAHRRCTDDTNARLMSHCINLRL